MRGATGNRTRDTRIFSPLLYQLSYDTRNICLKCGCKDTHFFKSDKFLSTKKCISRKNNLPLQHLCEGKLHSAKPSKLVSALVCITFAPQLRKDRNVAQLVAHYVRDVGVGRSSRLIPTEGDNRVESVAAFSFVSL